MGKTSSKSGSIQTPEISMVTNYVPSGYPIVNGIGKTQIMETMTIIVVVMTTFPLPTKVVSIRQVSQIVPGQRDAKRHTDGNLVNYILPRGG